MERPSGPRESAAKRGEQAEKKNGTKRRHGVRFDQRGVKRKEKKASTETVFAFFSFGERYFTSVQHIGMRMWHSGVVHLRLQLDNLILFSLFFFKIRYNIENRQNERGNVCV